ncbi:MAG: NAD(P)/FAD-dependent oxidoreductase, partial [Proteobacteria bacterium]|nr:NAD(P)/FAD-dependent oxidoreductase [Pseudomonadota bacterium]
MSAPKKILIIGNGGAALHAVQALRGAGYEGEIHLVSDVRGPAFNPMLSPYYLAGKIPFDRCYPFGQAFYDTHRVICHFGLKAESLDPANRKCFLTGRREVDYDRCLIATGASPLMPPVPGLSDCTHAKLLRTAEQTRQLGRILPSVRSALILGASLVGIKLADTLSAMGIQVILADLAGHVLPHVAHADCAAHIENHLRECGIELRLKSNLEGAEDFDKGIRLYFRDQGPLDIDLCVVCAGIRPNMEFLEETSVKRGQGIHVDYQMQTSAPDLYAAGDVSQGVNLVSGEKEVIALWGNACNQGRTAGLNMAGRRSFTLGSMPQYVNTFFG